MERKLFSKYLDESYVSFSEIKELEKFADKLLNVFGIDIEFTRHFRDRMGDERNKPEISMDELRKFFVKVYRNAGEKIKKRRGDWEAVMKDIQTDINMPVVIDYDHKNKEWEVRLKTIMRKRNFRSPDPFIKY